MMRIRLVIKDWFSGVLWRGWGAMLLAVFSLLLLVSCSGGSDGSSDGGGSGSGDRDEPSGGDMFQDVKWEITPFSNSSGAGLEIRWENLEALKGLVDLRYLLVTIRGNSSHGDREYNISITDFEDTIYRLTNLTDGEAYKVVDASIDLWTSDGLVELPIDWLGSSNGDAHKDTSAGIEVGSNYDKDGLADRVDPDDDNDGIDDFYSNGSKRDVCPFLAVVNRTDHIDTDGDRLGDACDPDDDNDGLPDTDEGERQVNKDGVSCSLLRDCDNDTLPDTDEGERRVNKDGVRCSLLEDCDNDTLVDSADLCPFLAAVNQANNIDTDGDRLGDACDPDDDNDGLLDTDEGEQQMNKDGVRCSLLVDCDGDSLADNHTTERLVNGDGESCSLLVDCDGDRLADNHTTERLVNGNGERCLLLADCDGDRLADNHTTERLVNGNGERCLLLADCDNDNINDNIDACPAGQEDWEDAGTNDPDGDGCHNDEDIDDDGDGEEDAVDIDDDGDGLIEIGTAAELNMVRWVLNGSGLKSSETASLNTIGCGDGTNIMACNGYELIDNISLNDYIAETDEVMGWQPIAHDINAGNRMCDGEVFSGTFDGNGFAVTGLFINRSRQDCVGLFGWVDGEIRRLGVVAEAVIGDESVGGLVGYGDTAKIVQSYAVNGEVRGHSSAIGGLVGEGQGISVVQSYAVNGLIYGKNNVGGLLGYISGSNNVIQSYAVSDSLVTFESSMLCDCEISLGGVIGYILDGVRMIDSYAVTGPLVADKAAKGGVTPIILSANPVRSTFWDVDTSGIPASNPRGYAGTGYSSSDLRSPTTYEGIYSVWADGVNVAGIDDNSTIWCDEDASGMIEEDEKRDASHAAGDNRIWDFGTADDYPALRCAAGSLADQRAWWRLNSEGKPALDRSRLTD